MITHLKSLFFLLTLLLSNAISLPADDWSGWDYEENSTIQLTHAERLLNSVNLNGDEKILDVGCGDGKITALMAQKTPNGLTIGIDPSTSMLMVASKHADNHLAFLSLKAEDFELNDQFDHIFSIFALHWVPEQLKALKNFHKHLKPGGEAHLILAPSKEGLPFDVALKQTLLNFKEEFKDFENPQQFYDLETYRKLLVEAGLHPNAIHYVFHQTEFENLNALKLWLMQWLPHPKHLSDETRELFMTQLLDHYQQEIGISSQEDGPIKWGEYVLMVHAKRP